MSFALLIQASKFRKSTLAVLAAASAAVLAACGGGGGGGGSTPTLQGVTLTGPAYAVVGQQQHFTATGHYSDGSSAALTLGVTWASSDRAVASVDGSGVVAPWSKGHVQISATDDATGLSAQAELTARTVTVLAAARDLPASGQVDTGDAVFEVTGLTPGAMYVPTVSGMSDDVDVTVYADITLAPETQLCRSARVGMDDEACVAPASAAGELWVVVDGQWTRSGGSFHVAAPAAVPEILAATVSFPAQLPYDGVVGAASQFLAVTGLTPGTAYQVRLSSAAADLDLAVYADPFEYLSLCQSYHEGLGDESCVVRPTATGELLVEVDGQSSPAGGAYALSVTAQ